MSPLRRRQQGMLLLDTNVWRYVADAEAGDELYRAAVRNKVRVQVAPSAVYEALRTRDGALRARLLSVMTRPHWSRLMPEVLDEAHEFLHEVRRLRPEWVRPHPNRERARRLQYDWVRLRRGFWDRARLTPDVEANALTTVEGGMVDKARVQAEKAREHSRGSPVSYETISLTGGFARPAHPLKGWNGNDVEPWRIDALSVTSSVIDSGDSAHAFVEWIGNEVDLGRAISDRTSWNHFWLYEVDLQSMPRHWLRWAFETLQSFRRVTDGTPCDAQLGTYLTQCDWFVTADKALADMVSKVRESAPFRIGSGIVVPGGASAVVNLLENLDALRARRP